MDMYLGYRKSIYTKGRNIVCCRCM